MPVTKTENPLSGTSKSCLAQHESATSYSTANKTITVASDRLVYEVYGVREVAVDILDHPEKLHADRSILGVYKTSMHLNGGRNLSTGELKQLASRLEQLTTVKYPNVVGREQEVAVMENGKITSFQSLSRDEYELTLNEYNRALVGSFPHSKMTGICGERKTSQGAGVKGIRRFLFLFSDSQFKCIYQPIDKLVVTNSTFEDCLLYYDGDPVSYFGSNNIVRDSTLILGPDVSDDSQFVKNFRELYPNVQIKRGTSSDR